MKQRKFTGNAIIQALLLLIRSSTIFAFSIGKNETPAGKVSTELVLQKELQTLKK